VINPIAIRREKKIEKMRLKNSFGQWNKVVQNKATEKGGKPDSTKTGRQKERRENHLDNEIGSPKYKKKEGERKAMSLQRWGCRAGGDR